jgi:hypothetical protein
LDITSVVNATNPLGVDVDCHSMIELDDTPIGTESAATTRARGYSSHTNMVETPISVGDHRVQVLIYCQYNASDPPMGGTSYGTVNVKLLTTIR